MAPGWRTNGRSCGEAPNTSGGALSIPRLMRFLPAGTILEIAPGFGRFTQYLLPFATRLIGVDLSPKCVEACRSRFPDSPQASFLVNDGLSFSHG